MRRFMLLQMGAACCLLAVALMFGTNAYATHVFVLMGGDDRFHPDSTTVAVGDTVTWTNQSLHPHTTTSGTSCLADGLWDSDALNTYGIFTHVTTTEGVFPYFCAFHCFDGMVGTLVVTQVTPTKEDSWGQIKALYKRSTGPR